MKRVFLSLGSNLGDRVENIRAALAALARAGIEVRRVSSLYRTEPVDVRAQPRFVNCVAEVGTELMPLRLLKTLQRIEKSLGRRPGIPKGPRRIDLDILLYENAVIRSAALTVPHERLSERRFALVPLEELEAHLRHPVLKTTVAEMLHATSDTSQVVRLSPASDPSRAALRLRSRFDYAHRPEHVEGVPRATSRGAATRESGSFASGARSGLTSRR